LHRGVVERRDDDVFGSPVNRAARIMKAAHGGQILLSQAVCDDVLERLPADATLRDLGAKIARSQGFTVTEQRLELYGICRDCARLDGRRATARPRAAQPRSAP